MNNEVCVIYPSHLNMCSVIVVSNDQPTIALE